MNYPYYHKLKFSKNLTDFMKSIENSHHPYYGKVKFSQKSSFVDVTWKFAPGQTCWNLCKKYSSLDDVTWKFNLSLLSRGAVLVLRLTEKFFLLYIFLYKRYFKCKKHKQKHLSQHSTKYFYKQAKASKLTFNQIFL